MPEVLNVSFLVQIGNLRSAHFTMLHTYRVIYHKVLTRGMALYYIVELSCPFPTYFFIISVFDFKPEPEQKISLLLVLCAGGLTTYPLLSVPIAGKFSACASNLDTHKHKHHPC